MKKTRTVEELEPGDLLTKMECCAMFCRHMHFSQTIYYRSFRPYIKFKNYGPSHDKNDNPMPPIERIPFEVVIGLLNRVRETPDPSDPPSEILDDFIYQIKKSNVFEIYN